MKDLVSIVIRTWNRKEDLKETLEILKNEQYIPLEIIVVDNGSTDGTDSMMTSKYPEVHFIKLSKNLGVEATNIGIEKAKGKFILLLDDDSHPQPGSISKAVEKFKENSKLGILAFKTIDSPTNFCPQEKFEKGKSKEEIKSGIKVKIFRGGGVMVKKEVVEKVGGYPKDFFWVGEESDLAMRALYAGYEIRYFPELIVIHRVSPKNRDLKKKTYYETRNLIWLYWKYSPVLLAFLKTTYSVFHLGFKALRNKVFLSYFKGLIDGIKKLPSIMKQRKIVYTQTIKFLVYSFCEKIFRNFQRKHEDSKNYS